MVMVAQVGGNNSPFLLRLIHLMQDSIPTGISVGNNFPAGTKVGAGHLTLPGGHRGELGHHPGAPPPCCLGLH